MPIRFRCAYCNQLLGIARRKANQVVRCPTCAGQVVVPQPEGDEESPPLPIPKQPPPVAEGGSAPPVFERSDFEDLFNEPVVQQPIPGQPPEPASSPVNPPGAGTKKPPAPPAPAPAPGGVTFDVERVPPPASKPPVGIVLSPIMATVLTVVWIVTVALAFSAGWLIRHLI
jgi:hypothetical protein